MNTLDWAKAYLLSRLPVALTQVERPEADSKAFRSFVVVFPIAAIAASKLIHAAAVPHGEALAGLVFIVLELAVINRYVQNASTARRPHTG